MLLLEIRNLSKLYHHQDGPVDALRDITFDIEKGDFVTITGPSGAGKTTLLLMLGGLMRPTSGSIQFRNQAVHELNDSELADYRLRQVGFVMQNFSLIPYLSAKRNAMIPMVLARKGKEVPGKRASELLEEIGLGSRKNHLPRELSAGEQQRVAVARALANSPSMILADEPTGNLDPSLAGETLRLLSKLNREKELTIVMVTHNPEAASFGRTKVHLDKGHAT